MHKQMGRLPRQFLDGIGAGLQSVAVPGLVARILSGTGRVNVGQGAVMTVQGLGAQSGDWRMDRARYRLRPDLLDLGELRAGIDCAVAGLRFVASACLRPAERTGNGAPCRLAAGGSALMGGVDAATWGIAGLATFGVIARPWNFPEFIWAAAGAALLGLFNLLPWPDALAAAAKGTDLG
jgi:hypothetical protein